MPEQEPQAQAGIIDEIMGDMMDSAMDEPDLEEETEEEVDKVSIAEADNSTQSLSTLDWGCMLKSFNAPRIQAAGEWKAGSSLTSLQGAPIKPVPQVLMEIAGESLEQLAGSAAPRQKVRPAAAAEAEPDEDEALQARLDAVRS